MYALFILGELMDRSMHGYLLHTILNHAIGPVRKMSWGVLYPLIHGLETDSLIVQAPEEDEPAKAGKKKKTYRITEAGRARFHLLMEEPIEYTSDYEQHFHIKLANFDQVEADVQFIILNQYKDFLRYMRRNIESTRAHVHSVSEIPPGEVRYLRVIFEHRLEQLHMNETWVSLKIQQLKNGNGE